MVYASQNFFFLMFQTIGKEQNGSPFCQLLENRTPLETETDPTIPIRNMFGIPAPGNYLFFLFNFVNRGQ